MKIACLGTLLLASSISIVHAATIAQLRRMLDVTTHRGGEVNQELRDRLDPTKEAFWIKTVGLNITQENIKKVIAGTNNNALDLSYCNLTGKQLKNILEGLAKTKIETLWLDSNPKLMDADFSPLGKLKHLKILTLYLCNLTEAQLKTIMEMLAKTSITTLHLYGNPGLTEDVRATLKNLKNKNGENVTVY